jgi:hypothetical protein
MLMVQLGFLLAGGVGADRVDAYAEGRPLKEVATDVVARRLRLDHANGDRDGT